MVFHYDFRHRVLPIKYGYRVTVTFDLVIEPQSEEINISSTINKLKSLGANRIGFFCLHRYIYNHEYLNYDIFNLS